MLSWLAAQAKRELDESGDMPVRVGVAGVVREAFCINHFADFTEGKERKAFELFDTTTSVMDEGQEDRSQTL